MSERLPPARSASATLRISCADCVAAGTDACDDCLVTYMCTRDVDTSVVVDLEEWRALETMGEVGLIPRLRHRRAG